MSPSVIQLLHLDTNQIVLVCTIVGLVVAVWTGWATVKANRAQVIQITEEDFKGVRQTLRSSRKELTWLAAELQTSTVAGPETVPGTPFLTRAAWLPDEPLALDHVALRWDQPVIVAARASQLAARVLPRRKTGVRYRSYSDAMGALSRPTLFFDGPTYSLSQIDVTATGGLELGFHKSSYFPTIDVAEALCHEFAMVAGRGGAAAQRPLWRQVPLRRYVSSGLVDPRRRPVSVAITTLLMKACADGSREFFLNMRDGEATATYAGSLMLVPTGVFQPGSLSPSATMGDFSLWHNIMREFSEEVLGKPEFDGRDGATVDYENDEPYRSLNRERRRGAIRLFYLGFGLDPLELWPHLLTAMVVDEDALGRVAPHLAERNAEGVLVGHTRTTTGIRGIPFDRSQVESLLASRDLSSPSAAALQRAWAHESRLRDPD